MRGHPVKRKNYRIPKQFFLLRLFFLKRCRYAFVRRPVYLNPRRAYLSPRVRIHACKHNCRFETRPSTLVTGARSSNRRQGSNANRLRCSSAASSFFVINSRGVGSELFMANAHTLFCVQTSLCGSRKLRERTSVNWRNFSSRNPITQMATERTFRLLEISEPVPSHF